MNSKTNQNPEIIEITPEGGLAAAPMTADFAKTVNAVGIGSSAWLERSALKPNKIKAFLSLKINEDFCCYHNML